MKKTTFQFEKNNLKKLKKVVDSAPPLLLKYKYIKRTAKHKQTNLKKFEKVLIR